MPKVFRVVLALLIGALLVACDRDLDSSPPDTSIFPIEDGKYRTYVTIDTSFTSQVGEVDTVKMAWKREFTEGTVTDQEGRELSRREVLRIPIDTAAGDDPLSPPANFPPETFDALWTQFKDRRFAERREGNIRFQLLAWPVEAGREWNGNALNNQGEELYRYTAVDTTVTVAGQTYENCVMVLQREESESFLFDVLTYEIYAPGIGKILRFNRYIEFIIKGEDGQNTELAEDSRVHYEFLVDHNYDVN